MKTLFPLIAVAALSLAACSQKAQNETGEAADAIAADVNATASEAVQETGEALDATGAAIENGADRVAAGAEATGSAIENGAESTASEIDNAM